MKELKGPVEPELIRFKDFAALLSVSTRQLYRLIDEGTVPKPFTQGSGRSVYFLREDLETYLAQLRRQRR